MTVRTLCFAKDQLHLKFHAQSVRPCEDFSQGPVKIPIHGGQTLWKGKRRSVSTCHDIFCHQAMRPTPFVGVSDGSNPIDDNNTAIYVLDGDGVIGFTSVKSSCLMHQPPNSIVGVTTIFT